MQRRQILRSALALPVAFSDLFAREPRREVMLPFSLAGRPIPVFQNGFLALLDSDFATSLVIDSLGNLVMSRRITIPDASATVGIPIAVSKERHVAVSMSATDTNGRFASMIVLTDFPGSFTRVIRTTPFAAGQLIFLPDGRLLCVGREHNEQFEDVEGHNILRFYSPAGVLINKAVDVNLMRPNKRERHPLNWNIVLGTDRVGLVDRDKLQYVEFDLEGRIIRPLNSLGIEVPAQLTGMAILSSGVRLASTEENGTFKIYKLRDSGNQVARETITGIQPPDGAKGLRVLGMEGDEIVFLSQPSGRLVFTAEV